LNAGADAALAVPMVLTRQQAGEYELAADDLQKAAAGCAKASACEQGRQIEEEAPSD
jgi:hypothetical protein